MIKFNIASSNDGCGCMLTMLIIVLLIAVTCSGCDKHQADGRLIKMDDKYYRMENRVGNLYALEPINMDTIIVIK